MKLLFTPISREQAIEQIGWKYEPPYDLYNTKESDRESEVEATVKPENLTFAVQLDGDLVGVRSFGEDGKVKGGSYDDQYQDTGGALRPDLTGKGLGEFILRAGLRFGAQELGFQKYRVTVAAFNTRALTVCRRVGFVEFQRFLRPTDKMEFVILTLETVQ